MARQAILERLGWRFVRIRGTAFFRDPDGTMAAVFARLGEFGVAAKGPASVATPPEASEHVAAVVRRAAEIERGWQEDKDQESNGREGADVLAAAAPSPAAVKPRPVGGAPVVSPVLAQAGVDPNELSAVSRPGQQRGAVAKVQLPLLLTQPEAAANEAAVQEVNAAGSAGSNSVGRARRLDAFMEALAPRLTDEDRPDCKCSATARLRCGPTGPLTECPVCSKVQPVGRQRLVSALAVIAARCDCGEPMRIARAPTGAPFIGCSDFPRHRKSISWRDF
jgi:hypothetical protein